MYKTLVLLFIASSSAQYLPNGCPSDFHVHLLLPHETDCDKFYSCSNGQRILLSCAPGTLFDESLQICNHAFLVQCTTGSTTTSSTTIAPSTTALPDVTQSTTDLPDATQSTTDLPDATQSTTDQPDLTESVTEQSNVTQSTSELPDITQATTDQPDITESTTEQLNITESTPEQPDTIQTTTEQPETTQPTTSQATTEAGFLPNGCPIDFYDHHMLPHETDCAKFYLCYLGEKVETDCPIGMHFDFVNQVCKRPSEVNCQITTTVDPVTTDPTATYSTTTDYTTTIQFDTTTVSSLCSPGQWRIIADPDSCTGFFICLNGLALPKRCPRGFEFNTSLRKCVFIAEGGCTWGLSTIQEDTTTPQSTTTEDNITSEVTTEDSTTSEVTTEDNITSDETTEDNTTSDVITEDNTTSEGTTEANTTSEVTTEDNTTSDVTTEYNTTSDVTTEDNITSDVTTEDNTTSDVTTEDNTTSEVTTEENTTSDVTTEDNTTSEVTTEENTTSDVTTEDNTTSEVTTEAPICHPDEIWNVADPNDCTRYFMCVGGAAIPLGCPNGFEFNPTFGVCVPISDGGCTYNQNAKQISLQIQPEPTSLVLNLQESFFSLCNGVEGRVKDPENCASFYLCSEGTEMQFYCDFGMEFSSEIQQCTMISGNECSA